MLFVNTVRLGFSLLDRWWFLLCEFHAEFDSKWCMHEGKVILETESRIST